jgi:hypothetical protein
MKRPAPAAFEEVGSDSFLDIVSNVVGILIILVMVTGARVRHAILEARSEKSASAANQSDEEWKQRQYEAARKASHVEELARAAADIDHRLVAAQRERAELGTLIRTAELQLDKERGQMTASERDALDVAQELARQRSQLAELRRQQHSALSEPPPEVRIESYPTPLSKQVFSHEQHFRLLGGRLCYVPFYELKDALMGERRQLIWQLRDMPEVTGSVGPIGGFRLDYHFVRTAVGGELTHALFFPVATDLGEPFSAAMQNGSEFRRRIDRLDPAGTTVTVWTYPDSFKEFRILKQDLYARGFAVAARPMHEDGRIGFSPRGSRSAAE